MTDGDLKHQPAEVITRSTGPNPNTGENPDSKQTL